MKFKHGPERDNFLYDMNSLSFEFENLESLVLDLRSADDEDNESQWRNHEYDGVASEWSGMQLAPPTIWEDFLSLQFDLEIVIIAGLGELVVVVFIVVVVVEVGEIVAGLHT